jgi:phage terminase small subunit
MAAISELTAGRDGIKIKTHSPLDAIKQLSKMQGWETAQKVDLSSSDGSMTPKPSVTVTPEMAAEILKNINGVI